MIRILCGGSPCTHWSCAQKNNRETEPSGIGWELFKNCLIAKDKFNPDYFLYENNKSAAQPIKDQIAKEFGVTERSIFSHDNGVRMTYINSALVSAQNRQRFYVTNFGDIGQPEDRGILLRDILESGVPWRDKGYCLDAHYARAETDTWYKRVYSNIPGKQQHDYIAVPVGETGPGKAYPLTATYSGAIPSNTLERKQRTMVAEPVCIAQRGRQDDGWKQQYEAREDGKTNALTTVGKDNAVAEPIPVNDINGKSCTIRATCYKDGIRNLVGNDIDRRTCVALPIEPPACLRYERTDYAKEIRKGYEDGTIEERMCNLREWHPREDDKSNTLTTVLKDNMIIECADGKRQPIYEVRDGYITIKDKQYPIKLADGYYIIRKLTVKECMRLQTVPDWYIMPCSASQNYKLLGNSWTVEVIMHLLNHIPNIRNEDIEVLSMYDGMSAGQVALKQMGCNVIKYTASEIDKYAIQTTQHNFPGTIQIGDAFQVRDADWSII